MKRSLHFHPINSMADQGVMDDDADLRTNDSNLHSTVTPPGRTEHSTALLESAEFMLDLREFKASTPV